jgi:uncharacterized protein YcfJ
MNTLFRNTALALAAAGLAIPAIPAAAADFGFANVSRGAPVGQSWEHNHRHRNQDRYYNQRYGYAPARSAYAEPVYRDTRTWRGNDGRYYCQKRDGTTGLIVGAAAGAIVGREIDKHGDRTLGTVLGAAAGALLGKEVAQGRSCR